MSKWSDIYQVQTNVYLQNKLLLRYLATNLKKLDYHVDQTNILPREELAKNLSHILDAVMGSLTHLTWLRMYFK